MKPSAQIAKKPVMLFGATGTAGRATALALREAGYPVVAAGRSDPKIAGVAFAAVNIHDTASLTAALRDQATDAVISCMASRTGAPKDAWAIDHAAHLNILTAAQAEGVKQFVLLSAICVQKPKLAFQHAKLAFEAALEASDLTHSIVRPTALFKSLSGQLERIRAGKSYLMFGDGQLTACKPISDADLGRYLVSCLHDPLKQDRILPIGGPGPALTPRQMGDMLFKLTGMPAKFRQVPAWFLQWIATGLRVGGWVHPSLRAKAELARIGQYYATESMLVWDADANRYDAAATPEFGNETLFDFYENLIAGRVDAPRGDHAVF